MKKVKLEDKYCKKCGKELPLGSKNKYCERCKRGIGHNILGKGLAGLSVLGLVVVAAGKAFIDGDGKGE